MFRKTTSKKYLIRTAFLLSASVGLLPFALAQKHYEPTVESLDTHPLPQWYDDAKLGIFIHWGLYSVPAWAPLKDPKKPLFEGFTFAGTPYAEWYFNSMRIPGSKTETYHREHYGADFNYYNFAIDFDKESAKWNPDAMAAIFRDTGAKYVVLTTKHHDGFTLWPSKVPNPGQQEHLHASRDIVGELTDSVRKAGMKMGLYYSGGYDWTFDRGPIESWGDFEAVQPQSLAYGRYAAAQADELFEKYHPSVFWNDINWPKTGNAMQVEANYYNAVPDGVVDDRMGIKHFDFTSPEYSKLEKISEKKWEECRGVGMSFGWNRAEGDAETLTPRELVDLLVDIVSKNGNLLLDVGPKPDGTIPELQLSRLRALGAWLKQNGEAIYGTHPWTRAEGTTGQMDEKGEPVALRFTQKPGQLFVTVLSKPTGSILLLHNVAAKAGSQVTLLGSAAPLKWTQRAEDLEVTLPAVLPGDLAWVLKLTPAK